MLMKSLRYEALAITIVFLALAGIACAQFSSDGTIVYMGDLSLQASSHWARATQATILGAAANNSTQDATSPDNQTTNKTSKKTISLVPQGSAKPVDAAQPSNKGIMNLSAYAKDRANGNLTGYTNIMYPITGSKGTTASTTSGGGCCGGG